MADPTYKYSGLPLTPNVFAELLLILAPGMTMRRNDAIDLVQKYHLEEGGSAATGDIVGVAKKALQNLTKVGGAESTGAYGYWRLTGEPVELDAALDEPVDFAVSTEQFEYVYVYYLPAYQALAEHKSEDTWPHKVGMTTVTVAERLRSQVGTALPEQPVIAAAFACADSALLEKAIHAVLELRGRKIRNSPGNEWFETNLAEIHEIARFAGWADANEFKANDAPLTTTNTSG